MRLLHVVASRHRRGAEIFASSLVAALSDDGVQQVVAVLRTEGGEHVPFDVPIFSLGKGRRRLPRPLMDLRQAMNLRTLVRGFGPDVVQAHGGEALRCAAASTLGRSDRLVYRRIGGAHPSLHRPVRRIAFGFLMRRAARIVTVAEALRDETIAMFRLDPDRVVTIPNGVDPSRMQASQDPTLVRDSLGIDRNAPVVLSLGAITWEKDPNAHLQVGRRVLEARRDAIHLIVGDGPLRATLEETVAGSSVRGRIRFLGVRDDIADLLGMADVVLFASRPDGMEGMPAVLIEAGMSGVPVAGFDVAGVREVIVDGSTGRIVPWRDLDGLASAVLQLFGSAARIGQNARKRCLERFAIGQVADRYMDVYRGVMSA